TLSTLGPPPTASTTAPPSSGSSATSTRSPVTSASAGTRRAGRGRWSRSAVSSAAPRCEIPIMRFEGQVAIVTGAAKGIGLRVARAFGREGARVVALDVNADGVGGLARELAADGGEALALKVDVTVASEVRRAVDAVIGRWGRVDVLVNNAGGFSVVRRSGGRHDGEA